MGLTTGACLAHLGFHVVCGDIDADKVARLEAGEIPIVEDGLDKIVADAVAAGRLRFVVGAAQAAADADIVFLCVPTPQDEDGSADLSYIEAAASEIGPVLRAGAVVVNKSTVPVGSTRVVERVLQRPDVAVVSNPEFLREGHGGPRLPASRPGRDRRRRRRPPPNGWRRCTASSTRTILITDAASAETIKYAANGFLAMKISFVNAVAAMCEAVGADVHHVIEGIGSDQRIGRAFLRPGPGWGGSCFPKDSRALVEHRRQARLRLLDDARRDRRQRRAARAHGAQDRHRRRPRRRPDRSTARRRVASPSSGSRSRPAPTTCANHRAWRSSPSCRDLGATIRAYDPTAAGRARSRAANAISPASSSPPIRTPPPPTPTSSCCSPSGPSSAYVDLDRLADVMRGRAVVDTRNLLDPAAVSARAASPTTAWDAADGARAARRRSRLHRFPPDRPLARARRHGRLRRRSVDRIARAHQAARQGRPVLVRRPRHHAARSGRGDRRRHVRRRDEPRQPGVAAGLSGAADRHARHRQHRHAGAARASPCATAPASSSPRRARSTAIRSNTRRSRATGATSTRSASVRSTTRRSGSPRRSPRPTAGCTGSRCGSPGSSTRTGRACSSTTGGS